MVSCSGRKSLYQKLVTNRPLCCYLDHDLCGVSAAVATILREKGQSVDWMFENKPLQWVFKLAARVHAPRLMFVGSAE
ncbi:unnamed protein product [Ilex paraguariensis]|uniref:Uncharacterized protein n=1 Tax=Ilex paraguariensis TaxID=185542 RepID=A0ABC8UNJ8_9AQUA